MVVPVAGEGLEPRVLHPSRMKTVVCLVGMVGVAVAGGNVVAGGNPQGWFWLVLGVAGALLFCLGLVRPPRLEIDADGLTHVTVFGQRWIAEWRQCGPFYAVPGMRPGAPARVVFDSECVAPSRVRLARSINAGHGAALTDNFGMSAADLADLLNRYRSSAEGQVPDA